MEQNSKGKLTDLTQDGLRAVYIAAHSPSGKLSADLFVSEDEANEWLDQQGQGKGGYGLIARREVLVDGTTYRDFQERLHKAIDAAGESIKEAGVYGWQQHRIRMRERLIEALLPAVAVSAGIASLVAFAWLK